MHTSSYRLSQLTRLLLLLLLLFFTTAADLGRGDPASLAVFLFFLTLFLYVVGFITYQAYGPSACNRQGNNWDELLPNQVEREEFNASSSPDPVSAEQQPVEREPTSGWRQKKQGDGTVRLWWTGATAKQDRVDRRLRLFFGGLCFILIAAPLTGAVGAVILLEGSRRFIPMSMCLVIGALLLVVWWEDIVRKEWRIGPGLLEQKTRLLFLAWKRRYQGCALELALTEDGMAALYLLEVKRRRFLLGGRPKQELSPVGQLLAQRTGWPLMTVEYQTFQSPESDGL